MNMQEIASELNAVRDELWRSKINLALSESRDENGDIDPILLETYLRFAVEGSAEQ